MTTQLSLDFEPGLVRKYKTLREVVQAGTYSMGLGRVAAAMDVAPTHLGTQLSGSDSHRRFPLDALETYIAETGDKRPIYWLIERFLADPETARKQALAQIPDLVNALAAAMREAGIKA